MKSLITVYVMDTFDVGIPLLWEGDWGEGGLRQAFVIVGRLYVGKQDFLFFLGIKKCWLKRHTSHTQKRIDLL